MATPFLGRDAFRSEQPYRLLPFRFSKLEGNGYLVTNDVGEWVVLDRDQLVRFGRKQLGHDDPAYAKLKARHFLFDAGSTAALDLLALKYRTRAQRAAWFTGLHIFVVTLRCDHSCKYCQVSRQTESRAEYDMSVEHADKAVDAVFRSPSPFLKIEFQGGEPLLNFPIIRRVVERATERNQQEGRRLEFVIASNLSRLTDEVLEFCRSHKIYFSTSLDGPAELHNQQRHVSGGDSHGAAIEGIARVRGALGQHAVAALMTTTQASLPRVEQIIDEYVRLDFRSIFLRSLSPFGFAARQTLTRRYDATAWIEFYQRGLAYILELNRRGIRLREEYSAIVLQKMLSPHGTSYVDLQSPAGLGISVLVYNYDGGVYASDEGRMLAEMGDQSFRLGHLDRDSYEDLLTSPALLEPLLDAMPEGTPMCSDCAFLPYCGSDPVFHRATQQDTIGHKAFSAFCQKQMAVVGELVRILEADGTDAETLRSWV